MFSHDKHRQTILGEGARTAKKNKSGVPDKNLPTVQSPHKGRGRIDWHRARGDAARAATAVCVFVPSPPVGEGSSDSSANSNG
jgi:hypothetical protein